MLYPGLLSLGQQFVVEYSTKDPQIARVAGRTAAVGTVMIAFTLGVTYLIAVAADLVVPAAGAAAAARSASRAGTRRAAATPTRR